MYIFRVSEMRLTRSGESAALDMFVRAKAVLFTS